MSDAIYPGQLRGLAYPVMKTSKESTLVQTGPNGSTTRNPQWQNPMWDWTLTYNYLKGDNVDTGAYDPYNDYQYLQGFYLARLGQADDFLFSDPSDNTVGQIAWGPKIWFPAGRSIIDSNGHQQTALANATTGPAEPTWNNSGGITTDGLQSWQDGGPYVGSAGQGLSLVNDGAGNYYSPLQRNFGGLFLEDVTDLDTSINPLVVWANGVLQNTGSTPDYSVIGPGVSFPGYSFMGLVLAWTAPPTPPITASFQFFFRVRFDMDSLDFEEFLYQVWTVGGPDSKNGAGYLKLTSSRAPGV